MTNLATQIMPDDEVCILTYTGRYVSPLDLKPDDIDILDIAHSLALQTRFIGHCREFYSVGQHCVMVSRLCPKGLELSGLMHDASEYILHDVQRLLKHYSAFGDEYRKLEHSVQSVIAEKYGFCHPEPKEVKDADFIALATERRDLMHPNGQWEVLENYPPLPDRLIPWEPRRAEAEFLTRFAELT